jgi:hypothetical protein
MKLNYLIVFNGQVMTSPLQMGNLHTMQCSITALFTTKENKNVRFINNIENVNAGAAVRQSSESILNHLRWHVAK